LFNLIVQGLFLKAILHKVLKRALFTSMPKKVFAGFGPLFCPRNKRPL